MNDVTNIVDPLSNRLVKDKKNLRLLPRPCSVHTLAAVMLQAGKTARYVSCGGHRYEAVPAATALQEYLQVIGDSDLGEQDAEQAGSAYGKLYALFGERSFETVLQAVPIPPAVLRDDLLREAFRDAALKAIDNKSVANYCDVLFAQWRRWSGGDTQRMSREYKSCFDRLYGGDHPEVGARLASPEEGATQIDVPRLLKPLAKGELQFMDELESLEDLLRIAGLVVQERGSYLYIGNNRVDVRIVIERSRELKKAAELAAFDAMRFDEREKAAITVGECFAQVMWELRLVCQQSWPFSEAILLFTQEKEGGNRYEEFALNSAFALGFSRWMRNRDLPYTDQNDPRLKIDKVALLREFREAFFG